MTLGRAVDAYLATLRGAEQASTRRTYGRVLRRVAAEFGGDVTARTRSAPSGSPRGSARSGRAGRRRRGTSRWTPSGPPRRTGSGRAGSPPTSRGCSQRRKPRPDRSRALSRAEVEQLLTREDIGLRERVLWRMLYETAARSAEVLAPRRRGPGPAEPAREGPPQGRRGRRHRVADRHRPPAAAPAEGPQVRPGVRHRAEGPRPAARGRPGRARPRPAVLPAGRGAVLQGLRRRDPAPAPALARSPTTPRTAPGRRC